jgi:hypothetical protein
MKAPWRRRISTSRANQIYNEATAGMTSLRTKQIASSDSRARDERSLPHRKQRRGPWRRRLGSNPTAPVHVCYSVCHVVASEGGIRREDEGGDRCGKGVAKTGGAFPRRHEFLLAARQDLGKGPDDPIPRYSQIRQAWEMEAQTAVANTLALCRDTVCLVCAFRCPSSKGSLPTSYPGRSECARRVLDNRNQRVLARE